MREGKEGGSARALLLVLVVLLAASGAWFALGGARGTRSGLAAARDPRGRTPARAADEEAARTTPAAPFSAPLAPEGDRSPHAASERRSVEGRFDVVARLNTRYTPIEPLVVHLRRAGNAPEMAGPEEAAPKSVSTRDSARFLGVAPRAYELSAFGSGWTSEAKRLDLSAIAPGRLDVDLDVHPTTWFTGFVRDGRTGKAMEHCRLTVESERTLADGSAQLLQEGWIRLGAGDGGFALGGGPEPSQDGRTETLRVRLVAEAPGYATARSAWFEAPAQVDGLVLILDPAGATNAVLSAHVVDAATGAGLAGARVALVRPTWPRELIAVRGDVLDVALPGEVSEEELRGELPRGETDAEGRVELTLADPWNQGEVELVAFVPERPLAWSGTFEVHPGMHSNLGTLAIASGARIEGHVGLAPGREDELASFHVQFRNAEGVVRSTAPGEGGDFTLEGVPAGAGTLLLLDDEPFGEEDSSGPLPVLTREVEVPASGIVRVDLEYGTGLGGWSVTGRATPLEGLTRWRIAVFDPEEEGLPEPIASARRAPDGSFEIDGVPPGTWLLLVAGSSGDLTRLALSWRTITVTDHALTLDPFDLTTSHLLLHCGSEAGASLQLWSQTGDEFLDALVGFAGETRTDAGGAAEIWGLPPGTYGIQSEGREGQTLVVRGGEQALEIGGDG